MPTAAETLIARLQADCTAAETAERAVRANVDRQLKDAEIARAFAWRRLSALTDMARIAASEPDREITVERQLCALFREIGWIEDGLADLGDDMPWADMRRLLDSSGAAWHGVAFFVGLAHDGGPLPDTDAAQKLKQVEADVTADPLSLNCGLFFDRQGRHMRIDEVANG